MNPAAKKFLKRAIISTVQPVVRKCSNVIHRIESMTIDDDKPAEKPKLTTAPEFLNHWQKTILADLELEFGHIRVPGFPTARPQYLWGTLNGAYLASALGIKRISVMEFGVAGGNGLVVLEAIAEKVSKCLGVEIEVYGFDTGTGNPRPTDYRDVPNLIREANYPMDVNRLKKRLKRAELVLGLVENTIPAFVASRPAPVAFAAFDFAMYSATAKALKLFEADPWILLPRIQCYFVGALGLAFSDFTSDRAAIAEFNAAHSKRKISPCYGLDVLVPDSRPWALRSWLAHLFDHPLYCTYDGVIKILDNPLVV